MGILDELNKPKSEYYKEKWTTLTLKLKDLEERKDYKIFDTTATDPQKKWYMSGMEITASDEQGNTKTMKVEDTEFIKADIFSKVFKGKRKQTQFIRNVIINGQEYKIGLKKTANDKLNALIVNIQNMGNNPLEMNFMITKTGEGIKTEYNVVVAPKDVKPSLQINLTSITTPKPIINTPNSNEQALINAIKQQIPQDMWKQIPYGELKKAGDNSGIPLTEERAKELLGFF